MVAHNFASGDHNDSGVRASHAKLAKDNRGLHVAAQMLRLQNFLG